MNHPAVRLDCYRRLWAGLGTVVLLTLTACVLEGDDDDRPTRQAEAVQFDAPEVVTQARVLSGDPSSARCDDTTSTQTCLANNKDILGGRRTLAAVHDIQVVIQSEPSRSHRGPNGDESLPTNEVAVASMLMSNSATLVQFVNKREDWYPLKKTVNVQALGARLLPGRQSLVRLHLYDEPTQPANSFGLNLLAEDIKFDQFVNHGGNFFTRTAGQPTSNQLLAAAADFDGDGVDAIVFVSEYRLGIALPTIANGKVTDMPVRQMLPVGKVSSMVVANFFGRGPVVALLVATADGTGLQVEFYAVNPASHAISKMADKTLVLTFQPGLVPDIASARMAAGTFMDPTHEQLVVVYDQSSGGAAAGVGMVGIQQVNGSPREAIAAQRLVNGQKAALRVAKGRFLPGDPFEGLVLLQDFGVPQNNSFTVSLVGFGPDFKPLVKGTAIDGPKACVYGMQTGNFNRLTSDNVGNPLNNLNMQLALAVGTDCSNGISGNYAAAVWQVSPLADGSGLELKGSGKDTSFTPIQRQVASAEIDDPVIHIALAVVDLQGRSMELGAPTTLTIENVAQPSVMIAAPPMHADWVGGKLTNYTAAPDGFFARFGTSGSIDTDTSSTATTTWSFATEESLGATATVGDCKTGDCASFSEVVSAKQELGGSTAALNGRFGTQEFELSQKTSFHDLVRYSDSTLKTYIYPVLGRTVCPATKPKDCDVAERVPMRLVVAGPDTVRYSSVDAEGLPWYQPPWVPGNLLSYPATVAQLQAAVGLDRTSFKQMSTTVHFDIGGSETDQSNKWVDGVQSGNTVTATSNFSGKSTTSFHGEYEFEGLFDGQLDISFSVGGSRGFKNLTESKTTLTGTTGLSLSKNAPFEKVNDYRYFYTPYAFAQNAPDTAASVAAGAGAFGALQSGFVVDLDTKGLGGPIWQREYGSAPDLALLHPRRMYVTVVNTPTDANAQACVRYGTTGSSGTLFNCVETYEDLTDNPREDYRHHMRGLFITEDAAPGEGSNRNSAKAGTKMRLQARVHNLSLAKMPDGAKVMVRFYAMVLEPGGELAQSRSVLIGTGSTDGVVKPYHTDDDEANWKLVSVTLDTTPHAGKDLYFWVVTWMEDQDGKLLPEREGRGLKSLPSPNATYAEVVRAQQRHGNNVGFYDMPFHVIAPLAASAAAAAALPATKPSLTIAQVGSGSRSIAQGQFTMVAARVKVGDHDLRSGTKVVFYDGAPASGGKVIGAQYQPFMRAGLTYDFRVPFRPQTCGTHQVHVVTGPGTRFEHAVRLKPIELRCP